MCCTESCTALVKEGEICRHLESLHIYGKLTVSTCMAVRLKQLFFLLSLSLSLPSILLSSSLPILALWVVCVGAGNPSPLPVACVYGLLGILEERR